MEASPRPALTGAAFSDCGRYRWHLARTWDPAGPRVAFVALNPSTADATHDDPTIRRCIGFARRWGAGGVDVVNLYAFRATRPRDLFAADDPVGLHNDAWIDAVVARAPTVVLAWGHHGARDGRAEAVVDRLPDGGRCLGITKHGHPRHPLFIPYGTPLVPWTPPG